MRFPGACLGPKVPIETQRPLCIMLRVSLLCVILFRIFKFYSVNHLVSYIRACFSHLPGVCFSHLSSPSGMQWRDVQNILYGEEKSLLFPGLQVGGMIVDPAIFLQSSIQKLYPHAFDRCNNATTTAVYDDAVVVDDNDDDDDDLPSWRIFSKLGAGWSTSRSRGEILSTAYACLSPDMVIGDAADKNAADAMAGGRPGERNELDEVKVGEGEGYEFSLSVRGSVPGDASLVLVQAKVKAAMDATVEALLQGKLPI